MKRRVPQSMLLRISFKRYLYGRNGWSGVNDLFRRQRLLLLLFFHLDVSDYRATSAF